MVVQGQLVKRAICFSDLLAREQLIHSYVWEKQYSIMLRQTFFNVYESKFQVMMFTLANDHFIASPSSVTLTFNLPEQMFQMNNCQINLKSMHKCRSYGPDNLNLTILSSDPKCDLTFNLLEQMFQKNNWAKLLWNLCINVEVMARTSSI